MSDMIDEAAYLSAVTDAEKKLFSLRTLRDRLQNCYFENKNLKVEEAGMPEAFQSVECNLKQIPEEPVFNRKSKLMRLARKIFGFLKYAAILTVAMFIFTVAMTAFFTKPFSSSGLVGILFIISAAVTFLIFASSVGLALYETLKFNEAHDEWLFEKEEIEEENEREKNRAFGVDAIRRAKYQQDMEAINMKQEELTLVGDSRAEVYELIKGKIVKDVYKAESFLAELYSYNVIPAECRRIDSVMLIREYMASGKADTVSEAATLYLDNVRNGIVAKAITDIYDENANYSENMACFCGFLDEELANIDGIMQETSAFVEDISVKGVDLQLRSVKSGAIALEFRRTYDDSIIAQYAKALTE